MCADVSSEEAREGERDDGAEGVIDNGGGEEVRVEVDAFEAAFVSEDLGEGVDGSGVAAVARGEGLDDEAGAYEVERGEEEACDEVGGYGEEERGLVERGDCGEEERLEEIVDEGLDG